MISINELYIDKINKKISLKLYKNLNLIIGKNGSGKTSLFDYIGGLKKVKEGKILGNDSLVYLNQNFYYYSGLKVKDYIKFIYQLDGISDWKDYLEKYIDINSHIILNNVYDFFKKDMGMLSGGERQFIYTIIILSLERKWYLLDEPLVGLDEDNKNVVIDLIGEMIDESKKFIISSHTDLDLFYEFDDKILDVFKLDEYFI